MRKLLILLLPLFLLSTQLSARADGVSFGIPLPFPFLFYNFDQSYYAQPTYYGGYYRRPYYAPRYYPRATTTADIIAATIARGTATDGQAITGQAGTVTGLRARSSFRRAGAPLQREGNKSSS